MKKTNTEEVEKRHICDICEMKFTMLPSLKNHIEQIHLANQEFACSTCNKKYSSKNDLLCHKAEDHSKTFKCDSC